MPNLRCCANCYDFDSEPGAEFGWCVREEQPTQRNLTCDNHRYRPDPLTGKDLGQVTEPPLISPFSRENNPV